jgi:hypothetical protein
MSTSGKWKVGHIYAAGEKYIRVYRIRDTGEPDHSGNREYVDRIFEDDKTAQEIADSLNELEKTLCRPESDEE